MNMPRCLRIIFAVVFSALVVLGCGRAPQEDTTLKEIEGISSVKELGLVEFRIRKIIKANDVGEWYKIGDRKILFSCTAYLKAGVDMSSFRIEDVVYDKEAGTVSITVPHASLLSINMPPSEIKLEYDQVSMLRSSFTAQERNLLLRQGEKQIRDSVPSLGILEKAEENARAFFVSLFSKMGFSSIEVIFK